MGQQRERTSFNENRNVSTGQKTDHSAVTTPTEPVRESRLAPAPLDELGSDALLVDFFEAPLTEGCKVSPESARILAQIMADFSRKRDGGRSIYVPAPDIRTRNHAIRARFDGANVQKLATEYGLSTKQIRRIVDADIVA